MGSDHRGFQLKSKLLEVLSVFDIILKDVGTFNESMCDYPEIAKKLAKRVQKDKDGLGLLICKSGVGMCITANKFKGIYAACLTTPYAIKNACQHNAINVLCLPGNLDVLMAKTLIEVFLFTDLSNEVRHDKRRKQISKIEIENFIA